MINARTFFPIAEGKHVLLLFRPSCEFTPCPTSSWLITDRDQRPLNITDGHVVADKAGENIFYDFLERVEISKEPRKVVWRSFIYRYVVSQNVLNKLGGGLSPALHPKKPILTYRDFKGSVFVTDYTRKLVRKVYSSKDSEHVYKDPEAGVKPPPARPLGDPSVGIVPPEIQISFNPIIGVIPPPVEFIDDQVIRFYVLYDDGRIKKTMQVNIN